MLRLPNRGGHCYDIKSIRYFLNLDKFLARFFFGIRTPLYSIVNNLLGVEIQNPPITYSSTQRFKISTS